MSLNDDRFFGEASKDKLHIPMDHFRMFASRTAKYLCDTALFLELAMKDFHVGRERLS